MNPDGSDARRLVSGRDISALVLVSASKGTLPSELYTVDVSGRSWRSFTANMGSIAGMSWR